VRPGVPAGSNRRALAILGVLTACLQVGVASQWSGVREHQGALALAWAGAAALALLADRSVDLRPSRATLAAGLALWAAAVLATVAGRSAYHPVDRLTPLAAGVGLAVAAAGLRGVSRFRKAIFVLAFPLFAPIPVLVRVEPVRLGAWLASAMLWAIRFPATRDGALLSMPHSTLEVFPPCSGTAAVTQLLLLALLVLCLFPSTALQKAAVFASAVVVGYLVNGARIAFLATVAERTPDLFEYWDAYGDGAVIFPVVATAIALAIWWAILRRQTAAERGDESHPAPGLPA